jgi:ribonucleoside-diphosphate reductase alpha chain
MTAVSADADADAATPLADAPLGANALAVLARRYLRREHGVTVETPAGLFHRVARHVAEAERQHGAGDAEIAALAERFRARMASLEFLPNSPTLMNAGLPLGQLAACFVVPVEDSTSAIFEAVRWAAEIQKTGGGTGFAFSRLRPAGDEVSSTGGVSSGPVAFMQVFDVATDAIKQGGTRRGANMGILRVDHPDVLDFIRLKLDPARMRNFNLSVAITDAFMRAVETGGAYALVNPRTGAEVRRLDARRVFDLIANAAWSVGDPGLVFIDRIDAANPTPARGRIEATNPCGEQPLLAFESCTLGSITLGRFITNVAPADPRDATRGGVNGGGLDPARGDGKVPSIDWPRLRACIRDAVRFLDDVIDANRYPLPEIAEATRATRKIGLGVMGFADLLIGLGVPYDAPLALELAAEIAQTLEETSLAASADLAEARGPFPAWAASRWAAPTSPFRRPLRNATTTTVAPTGTISIIAGCSGGIEPLYAVAFERRVLEGAVLRDVNAGFIATARARGFWTDALERDLLARGRVRGMSGIPDDVQAVFATAHDLDVATHIRMQAAFQRHVHAAVSKTINLPQQATPADVIGAYRLAYDLGCKGITVYRDGSRESQVLAFGEPSEGAPARGAWAPPATDADCPECGDRLVHYARCALCRNCGWSVCA